jgi:hypothetical protein
MYVSLCFIGPIRVGVGFKNYPSTKPKGEAARLGTSPAQAWAGLAQIQTWTSFTAATRYSHRQLGVRTYMNGRHVWCRMAGKSGELMCKKWCFA